MRLRPTVPRSHSRALPSRRALLLGMLGTGTASVTGCYAHWRPRFSNDGWFNDVHTRCITPDRELCPRTLAEVVQYVKEAESAHLRLRAVGAGHSFSDVAVVDGWLLRTFALSSPIPLRMERVKPKFRGDRLFQVEGGIRLRALNAVLGAQNPPLALPNMGGWDMQTLAGVISTSTHGSGLEYGPFPSLVVSMVLVTAGGNVVQIERSDGLTNPAAFGGVVDTPSGPHPATLVQSDEVFRAAVVSLGSMGVIYSVVIKVEPAFWLHEERELTTWEEVTRPGGFVDHVVRDGAPPHAWGDKPPQHYELLVNPYAVDGTHMCVITRRSMRPPNPSRSADCKQRGSLLANLASCFGLTHPDMIPGLINKDPEAAGKLLVTAMKGTRDDCYEDLSYNVFNAGVVNELPAFSVDLGVDLSQTVGAVQRVLDLSRDALRVRVGVHSAPLSIRFVKGCDAYLSPQYRGPTCMIEIFALLGVLGTDAMLRDHELDLIDTFGARPHWGLDLRAIAGLEQLKRSFGQFDDWYGQYRVFNATGVFNGELTDRLEISMPGNVAARRSYQCQPLP